ncbi:MAG TPA: ATP-binding protein [Solirubrobacteraceae bacterium]|jgi:serine/threonine-protein kinase RsbW
MASSPPNVRLSLAATAENVVLVREMLSGVADGIGLTAAHLNDIQTAVTEACNNVVLHAYEDRPGPLDVALCLLEHAIAVEVRDRGVGIESRENAEDDGIGLHVIRTLARTVEVDRPYGGGSRVLMEFEAPEATPLELDREDLEARTLKLAESLSLTTVSIAPIALAGTVLPRLVSALAARAHFSTDRISDVQLLADTLVAHARTAMHGDRLDVDVEVEPRALELHVAPIVPGRGRGIVSESEFDGLGRIIEKLTSSRRVRTADGYERLTLQMTDRR